MNLNQKEAYLIPNWPAPKKVKAISSTRIDGFSTGVYQGLNLGTHVGDDAQIVARNRLHLTQLAKMPSAPVWLSQVHSNHIIDLNEPTEIVYEADASTTCASNVVCAVMTADCVPILVTNQTGTQVAAIHAGWRGLANGIVEKTLRTFDDKVFVDSNYIDKDLLFWIGPAIGKESFEVGQDVYDAFVIDKNGKENLAIAQAFQLNPTQSNKYFADMDKIIRLKLIQLGFKDNNIYSSQLCTYQNPELFYSYRRDGVTGRQASFIWIDPKI